MPVQPRVAPSYEKTRALGLIVAGPARMVLLRVGTLAWCSDGGTLQVRLKPKR